MRRLRMCLMMIGLAFCVLMMGFVMYATSARRKADPTSARVWTDTTGKAHVKAEFLGFENGLVTLRFARTGKVCEIPLGALSAGDQEFVKRANWQCSIRRALSTCVTDCVTETVVLTVNGGPLNPNALVARGTSRVKREDYDGAIRDFSRAIQRNPRSPHAYDGRGQAYHRKGDLLAAHRDFNSAVELDPKLVSAYRHRGENLYKLALDKSMSDPELDRAIERWTERQNAMRKVELKRAPWQPLICTKGNVSRPAVLRQMAKVDMQLADALERDGN